MKKRKNLTIDTQGRNLLDAEDRNLLADLLDAKTQVAENMLLEYGSVRKILQQSKTVLSEKYKVSEAKVDRLFIAMELGRRYLAAPLKPGDRLDHPDVVCDFFASRLKDREQETFAVVFINARYEMLHYAEMFHGTVDGSQVHIREIVKKALQHNAAAIFVAHNHPSGTCAPSQEDKYLTEAMQTALKYVDVHLSDHIIVAGDDTLSFAAEDLL